MCQDRAFDPMLCPLLRHLSAEEQEARMRDDPCIAACIEALGGKAAPDPHSAKLVRVYGKRAARTQRAGPPVAPACAIAS
jgi:hypothetical protein